MASSEPTPTKRLAGVSGADVGEGADEELSPLRRSHSRCFSSIWCLSCFL